MGKSKKTAVIDRIFDQVYDAGSGTLKRMIVTSLDVQDAKRYCNDNLGMDIELNSNPFNFMKDIVRNNSFWRIWPERIRDLGFIGRQKTGDGDVFEFVPYKPGDKTEYDEAYAPNEDTPTYPIQSLSLPLASKALGRKDESWLLQVAVNLRVIETHFAIGDDKQIEALELNHLQMDIKLRKVQIDALFMAKQRLSDSDDHESVLITVEAKQGNQRILTEQIARQVQETFLATPNDLVIPTAMVGVSKKGIYVVEFKAVKRSELEAFTVPIFHREAMFILQPEVKGI